VIVHKIRLLCYVLVLVTFSPAALWSATAQDYLDQIKAKMSAVKKYSAELRIKVDVPFLKAPESTASITFEAPDKTTIDAPGFAMIPKQGADLSAQRILSKPYLAVDAGTDVFRGIRMRKVKIVPVDDADDIATAVIWIDTISVLPMKVVTTTRTGGTVTAELVYDVPAAREKGLPSYVKLMMNIGNFELPKTMTGDFETPSPQKGAKGAQNGMATVEIWYTKYKIQ